jgi:hypothetical protein
MTSANIVLKECAVLPNSYVSANRTMTKCRILHCCTCKERTQFLIALVLNKDDIEKEKRTRHTNQPPWDRRL